MTSEYSPISWLISDKHSLELMLSAPLRGSSPRNKLFFFSFQKGNWKHFSKGTGLITVLSGSNGELVWKIVHGEKGISAVSQLFVWNIFWINSCNLIHIQL